MIIIFSIFKFTWNKNINVNECCSSLGRILIEHTVVGLEPTCKLEIMTFQLKEEAKRAAHTFYNAFQSLWSYSIWWFCWAWRHPIISSKLLNYGLEVWRISLLSRWGPSILANGDFVLHCNLQYSGGSRFHLPMQHHHWEDDYLILGASYLPVK